MTEQPEKQTDERRITPNPDVLAKAVGGDIVLVHLKTNRIYELNRTAGRLWVLLQEGLSPDEIETRLLEEFSADREMVKLEMGALIEELLDEQLLLRGG
jgi:Coenzyme PQQ synthesis protein D (PqqD)